MQQTNERVSDDRATLQWEVVTVKANGCRMLPESKTERINGKTSRDSINGRKKDGADVAVAAACKLLFDSRSSAIQMCLIFMSCVSSVIHNDIQLCCKNMWVLHSAICVKLSLSLLRTFNNRLDLYRIQHTLHEYYNDVQCSIRASILLTTRF